VQDHALLVPESSLAVRSALRESHSLWAAKGFAKLSRRAPAVHRPVAWVGQLAVLALPVGARPRRGHDRQFAVPASRRLVSPEGQPRPPGAGQVPLQAGPPADPERPFPLVSCPFTCS
jgi:hypothetical protein